MAVTAGAVARGMISMGRHRTLEEAANDGALMYSITAGSRGRGRAALANLLRAAVRDMKGTLAAGRPFIVTDGALALVVAVRGEPLHLIRPDGTLYDVAERDLAALLRFIWRR